MACKLRAIGNGTSTRKKDAIEARSDKETYIKAIDKVTDGLLVSGEVLGCLRHGCDV